VSKHGVKRSKVDASGSRPHEIASGLVTVMVHIWCLCGRHVQGSFKVPTDMVSDDAVMKDAIVRAEEKAKNYHSYHIADMAQKEGAA
jgi:hypothetical protein